MLPSDNGNYELDCVKGLTICGRTFSNEKDLEYQNNVVKKINNLSNALNSWNKRSLSIFGRNLLLKTFGLSQVIYSMQNTVFEHKDLKLIESICYNFLWNKKANKSKAYERISRLKLKQRSESGGISAPDVMTINEALKVKQLIRSTSISNLHSINWIQEQLLLVNPAQMFHKINFKCANSFVEEAVKVMNKLGDTIIKEILDSHNDNSKLSKVYYNLIASENVMCVVKRLSKNPIIWLQAETLIKKLGIKFVGQLINEYKFPSCDILIPNVKNIINACSPLLNILANRKELSYGLSFRDGFFLATNVALTEIQLTTRLIRLCLFKNNNLEKSSLNFSALKRILHPKEREVAFFNLHDVLLTNEKLFEMKLNDSPLCPMCNVTQTCEHIFYECTNSKEASDALAQSRDKYSSNPKLSANIRSLVNRILFLNRNRIVKSDLFISAIYNRIDDFDRILQFKYRRKELEIINKLTLIV